MNIFKVDSNAGVAVGGYKVHVFRCSVVINLWRIKVAWNRGGNREKSVEHKSKFKSEQRIYEII